MQFSNYILSERWKPFGTAISFNRLMHHARQFFHRAANRPGRAVLGKTDNKE